jgi:glycosyltransferase involved in cell wall biosynthesis
MTNQILLTIVIPTFNRLKSLKSTLENLKAISSLGDVEILVIDNNSNDNSWEWLKNNRELFGICIKQNPVNFGIEGNIIQSLFNAKGDYVWLLSDHMQINASEVLLFIEKLRSGLNFTFGYARVAQYSSVLPKAYTPTQFRELSQFTIGELIFYMGNISTFIINRKYLNQCGRSIYRFAGTSYPQLGAFIYADKDTTIVELPVVSSFSWDGIKNRRISYDTFRSRFIGFVRAMDQISLLNKNLKNINRGLKTRILIRALALDAMSNLCFAKENPVKFSEYLFCLKRYPGKIRLFLLLCVLFSIFPNRLRFLVCRFFFSTMYPKQYKSVEADYKVCYSSESIKE